MDITGKIIAALPMRSGTTKDGKQWSNVTYVVETIEQYPKRVAFDVMGDRINQFNIQVGETMMVQFDINAREYEGRWFNSIRAYNVNRNIAQVAVPPASYMQQQQPMQNQYYQQPMQSQPYQQPMQQGYIQPPFPQQQPYGSSPFQPQQELPFPPQSR